MPGLVTVTLQDAGIFLGIVSVIGGVAIGALHLLIGKAIRKATDDLWEKIEHRFAAKETNNLELENIKSRLSSLEQHQPRGRR